MPTDAAVPLQWPLVGRHAELELFSATLVDPRAHGFVIHGPPVSARPAWPTSAWPWPTRPGATSPGPRPPKAPGLVPLGALGPPAAGRHRRRAVRPRCRDVRGAAGAARAGDERPARAVRRRPPPAGRHVGDAWSASSSTPTSSSSSRTVRTARRRSRPASSRCGSGPACGASTSTILDRAAVDTLLHLVLGGPVEASTIEEIWTASQGNVLFVRELVLGRPRRRPASCDAARRVAARRLRSSPRRGCTSWWRPGSARLGPAVSDALDVLAVWEPTGLGARWRQASAGDSSSCSTGPALLARARPTAAGRA